jgi:hypothetical protein
MALFRDGASTIGAPVRWSSESDGRTMDEAKLREDLDDDADDEEPEAR